jgi:phospholipid-binding lipoprotein MlaA
VSKKPLDVRVAAAFATILALTSCGPAPVAEGIDDPGEARNRAVHGLNLALDRMIVGPGSKGYGTIVPKPLKQGVSNVADTLELPSNIANNLLQLRLDKAGQNTLRLAFNLTFGLGGVIDASTAFGVPEADTDFGETLYIWGVREGTYLVLPVLGPSTERDAVGVVVDAFLDPVSALLPRNEARIATGIRIAGRLGDRDRFSDTIDSILYESADGYAQQRLLYLQNRRFELGQSDTAATGEAESDAGFIDPYEDPYAQ